MNSIEKHWRFLTTTFLLVATTNVFSGASVAGQGSKPSDSVPVQVGIDVLAADGFKVLIGKKVGLVTNPTGVTSDMRSTIDVLAAAPEVQLVALFGPEHGVRGDTHAGVAIGSEVDAATGLPVYSLYGQTRKPTTKMLANLDALVYDIQDIGCRSYTYISTMAVAMEAAAENNLDFVVLDRPNPLTGNRMEGRPREEEYKSFVSWLPVPYVYAMTCGELSRMINGEGWLANGIQCKLTVVEMRGWRRRMWFEDTGLPWVPTSPHIPHGKTTLFYAATGIMGELQVVSEGVGYTLPFELAGAPFIKDAPRFANTLNSRNLPGVIFRPMYFKPYYIDRIKGQQCGGVQIHITDRDHIDLTAIQFHIMDVIRNDYPEVSLFGNGRDGMFDKVCGTDRVRNMFETNRPVEEIITFWNAGCTSFMKTRARYLLYD